MELNLLSSEIKTTKKIFECNSEQSVDIEVSLPDYFPEVSKILNCSPVISIHSKQCIGETISVGGQVQVNIIYIDDEGELNSYSCVHQFNKSIEAKLNVDECDVLIGTKLNYLNHKATAPRKLELHGSINLACECIKLLTENIVEKIENENLYSKCKTISFLEPLEKMKKLSYIEDEIQTGNYPAIIKIIRTECKSVITECKLLSSKVMLKGDLLIEIVYLSSDCRKFVLRHIHGFSQIIDCENIDELTECKTASSVISFETRLKPNSDRENCTVCFEAKVEVELSCYNKKELTAVCDTYSKCYNVVSDDREFCFIKEIECYNEVFTCKKTYELPECGDEIVDCKCEPDSVFSAVDNGKLIVKGSVIISTLYKNSDNEYAHYTKPVDFEYIREDCNDGEEYSSSVAVKAVDFTLTGNGTITVEVELEVMINVFVRFTEKVLASICASECDGLSFDEKTAVRLYFAENESVWDIAKKFSSCPETVCKINSIENVDCICNNVLLIPNK